MNDFEFCKNIGDEYMDFITDQLLEIGISLNAYASKKYQMTFGESKSGVEVKHDDKFKETGNVYIEISAINKKGSEMIDGGITKKDKSWLYLIGDYNEAFIFSKIQLLMLLEKVRANPLLWQTKYNVSILKHVDKDTEQITSYGLVIPIKTALRVGWVIKHLKFEEEAK